MDRFDSRGRLIIPIRERERHGHDERRVQYVVTEAYCPKGCSIMDPAHPIHGYPGLRIRFSRPGVEGEFVISAIEGDFTKLMLSGALEEGVKDDLFCPVCAAPFAKLVSCNCAPDADLVVIGLTPRLDYNNAVAFCNVTGCTNGSFVKSGDALRHVRLTEGF